MWLFNIITNKFLFRILELPRALPIRKTLPLNLIASLMITMAPVEHLLWTLKRMYQVREHYIYSFI